MGTEIKYVDPLSFQSLEVGDRVTVNSPNGVVVDMKVTGIGDDDSLVLGPLNDNNPLKVAATIDSVVLATEFRDAKSKFRTRPKEILIVTDKHGNKAQLRVDFILGNGFLVLDSPNNRAPMSFWNKLKFAWKIARR